MKTKYVGEKETLRKSPDDLKALIFDIMKSLGCLETISKEVAEHLVNSSLSGVDSHGIWRILQYAEYYQIGMYLQKKKYNLLQISFSIHWSMGIINKQILFHE